MKACIVPLSLIDLGTLLHLPAGSYIDSVSVPIDMPSTILLRVREAGQEIVEGTRLLYKSPRYVTTVVIDW